MRLVLTLLTWNHVHLVKDGVLRLLSEAEELRAAGHEAVVLVVDNGSNDGTQDVIKSISGIQYWLFAENMGAGYARNYALNAAAKHDSDFILFVDGDIGVIPGSVLKMKEYLDAHPAVGAVGLDSGSHTVDPEKMSKSLNMTRVNNGFPQTWNPCCAPTQYGLFSKQIIKELRFDAAFGIGWGFEDDDFGFKIKYDLGLEIKVFLGNKYLHRHVHGSVEHLRKAGFDPQLLYKARLAYLLKKWSQLPEITLNREYLVKQTIPTPGVRK